MAHLGKGDELAEDKPEVNHLWIGGGGQSFHHTCKDRRHHQHICQVHCQGSLKEVGLEEGGGKGDHHEQDGGQVGAHHLAQDLPPEHNGHTYTFLRSTLVLVD